MGLQALPTQTMLLPRSPGRDRWNFEILSQETKETKQCEILARAILVSLFVLILAPFSVAPGRWWLWTLLQRWVRPPLSPPQHLFVITIISSSAFFFVIRIISSSAPFCHLQHFYNHDHHHHHHILSTVPPSRPSSRPPPRPPGERIMISGSRDTLEELFPEIASTLQDARQTLTWNSSSKYVIRWEQSRQKVSMFTKTEGGNTCKLILLAMLSGFNL